MSFDGINFLAVVFAALIYFVLGALWYSPLLFDKQFMAMRGATREQLMSEPPIKYLFSLITDILSAVTLALILNLAQAATVVDGLVIGLIVSIGLAISSSLKFSIFSIGPRYGLWVIYIGYQLVGFSAMAVILTLWR
jgi:Protein of unknown function (DUF1761)